jgi:hypothetical protein
MKAKSSLWNDPRPVRPQDFKHGSNSPPALDANGCGRGNEPMLRSEPWPLLSFRPRAGARPVARFSPNRPTRFLAQKYEHQCVGVRNGRMVDCIWLSWYLGKTFNR